MSESLLVDISSIFAGGWSDVPSVEFCSGGGEAGAVDGVDASSNAAREGVAVGEIQSEQSEEDEEKDGETVLAASWKYWGWLRVHGVYLGEGIILLGSD